jgi:hypothetical protein
MAAAFATHFALPLPIQRQDVMTGLTQGRRQSHSRRPTTDDDDFRFFGQHYSS